VTVNPDLAEDDGLIWVRFIAEHDTTADEMDPDSGDVRFRQEFEGAEGGEQVIVYPFDIPVALWTEMGEPERITVTFEKGDTLNGGLDLRIGDYGGVKGDEE
jgi:hypothetical protein